MQSSGGDLVNIRLLGAAALTGVFAAGCGPFGDEAERHAAVVAENCLDCHNAAEAVGVASVSVATVSR